MEAATMQLARVMGWAHRSRTDRLRVGGLAALALAVALTWAVGGAGPGLLALGSALGLVVLLPLTRPPRRAAYAWAAVAAVCVYWAAVGLGGANGGVSIVALALAAPNAGWTVRLASRKNAARLAALPEPYLRLQLPTVAFVVLLVAVDVDSFWRYDRTDDVAMILSAGLAVALGTTGLLARLSARR